MPTVAYTSLDADLEAHGALYQGFYNFLRQFIHVAFGSLPSPGAGLTANPVGSAESTPLPASPSDAPGPADGAREAICVS
jgi:hypothetical protein